MQRTTESPSLVGLQRRSLLATGVALIQITPNLCQPTWANPVETPALDFVRYQDTLKGYSLLRPSAWQQVEKAGADALFRDPQSKATTLGVTILPVSISSLEQFGTLGQVGEKLLATESAKESTIAVSMLKESQRFMDDGYTVYDFVYELESTRGRKRVVSTVTIVANRLFVVNGNIPCSGMCDASAETKVKLVQAAATSLTIKSEF